MNLKEVAEKMKSELAEVIGRKPESVTRLYKDEKGWHAKLDVLEVSKIPSATDLIGDYEVMLDDTGSLVSFERKGMRLRGGTVDGDK
jgi:hypothetical protein